MTYLDLVILFLFSGLAWCALAFGLAVWTHVAVWAIDRVWDILPMIRRFIRGKQAA